MNKKLILNNKIFINISKISDKLKYKTYLIGGYVRNLLLFNIISYDIDIVTTGDSFLLAKYFSKKIITNKIFFFKRYKTAIIKYNNYNIEFVSTRKEYYNIYNNKPKIKILNSIIDDQKRRDFTINSIAICLNKKNFLKIIDKYNGIKDLKNKIIRTPINPNITFYEDPLRMIRAIRFSTQLNFNINKKIKISIINNIDRIRIIPIERIVQEFNKILLSKKPSIGLKLLLKYGFLSIILPELLAINKINNINNLIYKKNFKNILSIIDNINTNNIWLKWAILLKDIGKPISKKYIKNKKFTFKYNEIIASNMIPNIFHRLKLPMKNNMKYVQNIIKYNNILIKLSKKNINSNIIKKYIFKIGYNNIKDIFKLENSYINNVINNKNKKKLKNNIINIFKKIKNINKKKNINNIKLSINGNNIMKIFNIKKGEKVGIIKKYLFNLIFYEKIKNNYKDIYKFIKKKYNKLKLKFNL
ncbi:MAG: tRNA nucleotidyltransferase [Flavobacteriales endosymbiont of Rhyzopertha dominica]|nr:MAG: HD domain-containing protein [Candidatus Shikimatogenerans bostrichidophilus]